MTTEFEPLRALAGITLHSGWDTLGKDRVVDSRLNVTSTFASQASTSARLAKVPGGKAGGGHA